MYLYMFIIPTRAHRAKPRETARTCSPCVCANPGPSGSGMSVCVLCGSPVWPSPPVVGPLWGPSLCVGPL